MSYWKIAWRNIEQRALASSLTGLSMALGVALMVLVLVVHEVVVAQLSNDAQGYNFIIGSGQGSKFEIVLSTVFHVGTPLYPIPYKFYKKFIDGEFAPYTDLAVPVCLGDSYSTDDGQGFRVIGTTPDMFGKLAYGAESDGTEKFYRFQAGRNFKHENFFEAVIGSVASNRTGLKVGDKFRPTHGISGEGDKHDEFTVVGVLAPTGTANDRALFINMEGFYLLEGHALSPKDGAVAKSAAQQHAHDEAGGHDSHAGQPAPLPEAQREVTSILVRCKADQMMAPMAIEMGVNKGEDRTAQAVAPVNVVERLQSSFLAPMRLILLVLTVLIIVVAGISILVSIYNSMSERSHDIAVMRALGASRTAVMSVILVESILLSILGGLAGLLLGHGALALASPIVEYYTGITVRAWQFTWQESLLVPGLVAFAALVGFLPAVSAYRTDVGKTLGGAR
jgi:putative ABC transport system permease protein